MPHAFAMLSRQFNLYTLLLKNTVIEIFSIHLWFNWKNCMNWTWTDHDPNLQNSRLKPLLLLYQMVEYPQYWYWPLGYNFSSQIIVVVTDSWSEFLDQCEGLSLNINDTTISVIELHYKSITIVKIFSAIGLS